MSGEELDKKLTEAGYVKAEIARLLGVPPQSINQTLNAKDVKSGFIEDLCKVLHKEISFFYGNTIVKTVLEPEPQQNESIPYFMYRDLQDRYDSILRENQTLRNKLAIYEEPVEKRVAQS